MDLVRNHSDLIMTLFSDNSVSFQTNNREDSKEVSTIYPPPTAKEVVFIQYCMNLGRVFLMLISGALCIYRVNEAGTAILERMQHPNQIRDETGKTLSQQVSSITFSSVIPPKFDVEMWNDHTTQGQLMEKQY